MVLIAAGVRPNTSWLDGIINLDDRGLIEVDDCLLTSDSYIYAAGDATRIPYAPGNDKRLIPLASNARRQAVIAPNNIAAVINKFTQPAVSRSSGVDLFQFTVAHTV